MGELVKQSELQKQWNFIHKAWNTREYAEGLE